MSVADDGDEFGLKRCLAVIDEDEGHFAADAVRIGDASGLCFVGLSSGRSISQSGGVFSGQGVERSYQVYYRDGPAAFCPPATFNVTNGVRIHW